MIDQLEDIYPSAKAPLYRRISSDEGLSYLREGDGIIGFELDLEVDQQLSGFLLLGIQKHTVYAFKSDLDENPKLILFPPLDKLFDSTFEMLGLKVIEKKYLTNDFVGKEMNKGVLRDIVRNLTPPEKDIDLPDDVSERMAQELERVRSVQNDPSAASNQAPIDDVPEETSQVTTTLVPDVDESMVEPMDEPDMNAPMDEPDMNSFDSYESGFDDFESGFHNDDFEVDQEPEEPEDWRVVALENERFSRLSDVGEFVEIRLHVPKAVSTQVLNKALQSDVVINKRMNSQDLAVMLFKKLFEDGKL